MFEGVSVFHSGDAADEVMKILRVEFLSDGVPSSSSSSLHLTAAFSITRSGADDDISEDPHMNLISHLQSGLRVNYSQE